MYFYEPWFDEITWICLSLSVVFVMTALIKLRLEEYHRSRGLAKLRSELFPFRLVDMPIASDLTREANYRKIIELCPKIPTCSELIYLLKYKKFVDSPYVTSMCDVQEVDQMEFLMKTVINEKIQGSIVETGSYRGGMMAFCKGILQQYEPAMRRQIYLFDTFKYFPKSDRHTKDQAIYPLIEFLFESIWSVDQVVVNFEKYNLLDENVHLVEGLFEDTVPKIDVGPIAILRLDSDYYESTMFVLENYYQYIVKGAFCVVDDFNNPFLGCKDAVTEFRAKHKITSKIIDLHGGSVYWRV